MTKLLITFFILIILNCNNINPVDNNYKLNNLCTVQIYLQYGTYLINQSNISPMQVPNTIWLNKSIELINGDSLIIFQTILISYDLPSEYRYKDIRYGFKIINDTILNFK